MGKQVNPRRVWEAPIQEDHIEIGSAVETDCQGRGVGETLDRKAMIRQLVGKSLSKKFVIFDEEDPNGVGLGPKVRHYRLQGEAARRWVRPSDIFGLARSSHRRGSAAGCSRLRLNQWAWSRAATDANER
jgi:hypothetical protein